jgi:hypothetical protein
MEDWTSVPTGLPVGQNETAWLSHPQQVNSRRLEQVFKMAVKRADLLV